VQRQYDKAGELLEDTNEADRFLEARAGDHLMTPFQCELCHFRNILGRDPFFSWGRDMQLMELFRRANLDSFWARESSTVKNNLREAKRIEDFACNMGMPPMCPPMGPFPIADTCGMEVASGILNRSLAKGKYAEHVQYETFRKARSAVTNVSQAGVSGLGATIGAYEKNRLWISEVPTHSFWFTRFMTGIHWRVGEVRKQDEPITIGVLKVIEDLLEGDWRRATTLGQKRRIAEMGVWFVCGFCTGLRGEEMVLIELSRTASSLKFLRAEVLGGDEPWFKLAVSGRTKGNQLSGAKFALPCVATTLGSGLLPGKWMKRLVEALVSCGVTKGRLFQRDLPKPKLHEFEDNFFTVLEKVQSTSSMIGATVDVRDVYGILRSTRRGVTSHARNMQIPEDDIKAFNRWSKDLNARSGASRLDMIEVYSKLEALAPTLLRFSRTL
jgi:hypothetical protein